MSELRIEGTESIPAQPMLILPNRVNLPAMLELEKALGGPGHVAWMVESSLMPGEATNPLFTKVYFSRYMGNMYQGSVAFVNVHAEATQVANNGTNVLEALGWPSAD